MSKTTVNQNNRVLENKMFKRFQFNLERLEKCNFLKNKEKCGKIW